MKAVDYEQFAKYVLPCNLTVNEHGVFFVSVETDIKKDLYKRTLCRLENGKAQELVEVGSPSFWYDDAGLIFVEKQNHKKQKPTHFPKTKLRHIGWDGKSSHDFAELEYAVGELEIIDSQRFYFTAGVNLEHEKVREKCRGNIKRADKELSALDDYIIIDELPFCANGEGYTNGMRTQLFEWRSGTVKKISSDYSSVSNIHLSPDGARLVYIDEGFKTLSTPYSRLVLLETGSNVFTDITFAQKSSYYFCAFIDEGRIAVFVNEGRKYGLEENAALYEYSIQDKTARLIVESGEHEYFNTINSDVSASRSLGNWIYCDGASLFTLSTYDDSTHLIKVDIAEGTVTKITSQKGMISDAQYVPDGFYTIAHRGALGPEIYRISPRGEETRVSELNTSVNSDYEITEPESFAFVNERGDELHGYVLRAKKGWKKQRTVLSVHGGPKTAFGVNVFHEMQLLSALGFNVIYCNPTGSSGRGNEFANLCGKYGTIDYRDLMLFCEKAAEKYDFISLDNMAVIGGSYGGFMVNHMIGTTERFKAAVSQRSISDWNNFFHTSDIGPWFGGDQVGAEPWGNHAKMWEQSPIKNADRVKTPTLFIHSTEDHRCPQAQGISMCAALIYHGVPTRLCLFKGENHELSRSGKPSHRIKRLKEIVSWLDKYLD